RDCLPLRGPVSSVLWLFHDAFWRGPAAPGVAPGREIGAGGTGRKRRRRAPQVVGPREPVDQWSDSPILFAPPRPARQRPPARVEAPPRAPAAPGPTIVPGPSPEPVPALPPVVAQAFEAAIAALEQPVAAVVPAAPPLFPFADA